MITQVLCTIGYSSPFPQLALLVSIIFHFIKIITPRPLKDCIKLFWTDQATPGSSSHIGYQQVPIPHVVRRRYLKACGLERKGEDKITVKKREGTPLKQTNNIYVVKRKKKKTSNMRNKRKPNPGLPGQRKEASTHLCIDKMCSECASRDTNQVVVEGDAYIDDG